MNKTSLLEKIGLVLVIIGVILMVLNSFWDNSPYSGLLERHMLFYWLGMLSWALGYMQRTTKEKKAEEEEE